MTPRHRRGHPVCACACACAVHVTERKAALVGVIHRAAHSQSGALSVGVNQASRARRSSFTDCVYQAHSQYVDSGESERGGRVRHSGESSEEVAQPGLLATKSRT